MYNDVVYTECMTFLYDNSTIQERHILDNVPLPLLFEELGLSDTASYLVVEDCYYCGHSFDTSIEGIHSERGDVWFCGTECLSRFIHYHILKTKGA